MIFETLEPRFMPCTPLNVLQIIETVNAGSYSEQADINKDGMVSPLDVLMAINAANQRVTGPGEMSIQPNSGKSSLTFSPCGESLSLLVMSLDVKNPEDARVSISGEEYLPVEVGTLGKFQTVEFEVWGRGREWIKVLGDFEDNLLTVIVG